MREDARFRSKEDGILICPRRAAVGFKARAAGHALGDLVIGAGRLSRCTPSPPLMCPFLIKRPPPPRRAVPPAIWLVPPPPDRRRREELRIETDSTTETPQRVPRLNERVKPAWRAAASRAEGVRGIRFALAMAWCQATPGRVSVEGCAKEQICRRVQHRRPTCL